MNRNWEKIFFVLVGAIIFFVLDRVVVEKMTQDMKTESSRAEKIKVSSYEQSGLIIDQFPRPPSGQTASKVPVVPLDQTPTKGKTVVYSHNGNQLVRLHEFCTWSVRVDCVMLKTQAGTTPIHIHDVKVDVYVSGTIKSSGTWEAEKMALVMSELKKDPDFGFLDLGSHVGAYSLNAAKLGRKVVSVDPLIENTQRLCKSIQKGGFTDQMTIIFNPLSDSHSHVSFTTIANNIGATTLTSSSPGNKTHAPCDDVVDHPTVMLDDLIPVVPFKKAVMKMDVEEHEYHVVNGGQKFLKAIDVPVIFMEWGRVQKLADEAQKLIAILEEFGYRAHQPHMNGGQLNSKDFAKWPFDVLWRKM